MRFLDIVGAVFIIFFGTIKSGDGIRCFECTSQIGLGESNPCLIGDGSQIRRVHCIGPSVCAKYRYEARVPGSPIVIHINRGCQALRYGATCEDIFHTLKSRGEILPGQHTCATCSSDFCNSSDVLKTFSYVYLLSFTLLMLLI